MNALELMGHVAIPKKMERILVLPRMFLCCHFNLIAGGRESKEGRQTVFFTPLNPFGGNPDEEEPSDGLLKPRKVHCHSKWKLRQDAVYWINLARAQEKGLQFWQTRSHAITVHNSVPTDCIHNVIS